MPAMAADAVGGANVYGISMPSMYSSDGSKDDAADLAKNIGAHYDIQPIEPLFVSFQKQLDLEGVAAENLQARIRGVIVMAYSNSKGLLAVATGNKSELACGYSTIYGDAGEVFTVEQCLMALMLESANEMALGIGEEVSGSVKKFVELMNTRAQQLGCKNTHFNNPNGLPDETHVTTAGDMAKIAKAAWQNPLCRKFFTTDLYNIPPTNIFNETRYLLNHHKMMAGRDYAYDGVLGGKTGYTDAAGATLITYAKRGNMTLVAVVMNSVNGAWADTKSLLDYGFDNFECKKVKIRKNPVPKKNLPGEQYLLNNCGNTYPFYYTKNVYVTIPTGTDLSVLTKKQAILSNAVGPLRLKSKYYFNGQMVGWGMQYERSIMTSLLTTPTL